MSDQAGVDIQTELLLTGTAGPEAVAGQRHGDQQPKGHIPPNSPMLRPAMAGGVAGRVMAFAQVTNSVTNSAATS
jgi:hypothetical protein